MAKWLKRLPLVREVRSLNSEPVCYKRLFVASTPTLVFVFLGAMRLRLTLLTRHTLWRNIRQE